MVSDIEFNDMLRQEAIARGWCPQIPWRRLTFDQRYELVKAVEAKLGPQIAPQETEEYRRAMHSAGRVDCGGISGGVGKLLRT